MLTMLSSDMVDTSSETATQMWLEEDSAGTASTWQLISISWQQLDGHTQTNFNEADNAVQAV